MDYKIHKTQPQKALKILKQPPWLRKITISHHGLENKQPCTIWHRKFEVKKGGHRMPSLENREWWVTVGYM